MPSPLEGNINVMLVAIPADGNAQFLRLNVHKSIAR